MMESFDPSLHPDRVADTLSRLRQELPYSLPLYRRIQFAHFTPTSRITTSLPTTADDPWLITFSDPDRGPETQLHIYGSWEPSHPSTASTNPRIRTLLATLLSHLRSSALFSPANRTDLVRATVAARGVDPATDTRQLILCGSVHASTARLLRAMDVLEPNYGGAIPNADDPEAMPEQYNKWIFDLRGGIAGDEDALPHGLRWGRLRVEHYDLVRSRTSIPRKDRTLSMLPDVGVFVTGQGDEAGPVAWTFLGVDSSLTTLHVEPEYRGKGLAKAVVRKAWRDHLDGHTGSDGETAAQERWAHADVSTDNVSSNAMCKSLGGEIMWSDYWLTVDLTRSIGTVV